MKFDKESYQRYLRFVCFRGLTTNMIVFESVKLQKRYVRLILNKKKKNENKENDLFGYEVIYLIYF